MRRLNVSLYVQCFCVKCTVHNWTLQHEITRNRNVINEILVCITGNLYMTSISIWRVQCATWHHIVYLRRPIELWCYRAVWQHSLVLVVCKILARRNDGHTIALKDCLHNLGNVGIFECYPLVLVDLMVHVLWSTSYALIWLLMLLYLLRLVME